MSAEQELPPEGRRPGTVEGWQTRRPVNRRRYRPWRGLLFLGFAVLALLAVGWIVFGPALRTTALGLFEDNTQAIKLPFVSELLGAELAARADRPAGASVKPVTFQIEEGQTFSEIEDALVDAGLLTDRLVFQYLVISQGVDGQLVAGDYTMAGDVTPRQLVDRLKGSPDAVVPRVTLALRDGLRIEQIVALLETLGLDTDIDEFFKLVSDPPKSLRDEYDFLSVVPKGNSLEGFLGAGVFEIPVDITPLDLARLLLDDWQADIGTRFIDQARKRGRDFYEVLTIASLVERETALDSERGRIAGVYTNRLDPSLHPTRILNADPTVVYANDTMDLRDVPMAKWPQFSFWEPVGQDFASVNVPQDLESYQTYVNAGLPKGPIDSPARASIEAALFPETDRGLLYFYACPRQKRHEFARTLAQHEKNIAKCS